MKALHSFLSIALVFSFSSLVMANESCVQSDQGTDFDKIFQLAKKIDDLNWFGADSKKVLNSPCSQGMVINNKNLTDYFATKNSAKKISRTILGAKFEDESEELLEHFSMLVGGPTTVRKSIFATDDKRFDKSKIPANCKKVLCAIEATFGKDQGLRLLYMMDRYQLNGSHLVYENSSPWKAKELDTVLNALDDMPDFLRIQEKNKPLYHFKRGYTRGEDGVLANAVIEIFDAWNEFNEGDKRYTIFHELSHNLSQASSNLELDNTAEWLALSKWEKKGDDWKPLNISNLPSQYSATNPSEDFAESLSTYRYHPQAKKILGEEKYRFIKETVFLGLEFDKKQSCQNSSWSDLPMGKQVINDVKKVSSLSDEQIAECFSSLSDYLEAGNSQAADKCLYTQVQAQVLSTNLQNSDVRYPQYVVARVKGLKLASSSDGDLAVHPAINKVKLELRDTVAASLVEIVRSQKVLSKVGSSSPEYCDDLLNYKGALSYNLTNRYKDQNNYYQLSGDYSRLIKGVCQNLVERKLPLTLNHITHNLSIVMAGK